MDFSNLALRIIASSFPVLRPTTSWFLRTLPCLGMSVPTAPVVAFLWWWTYEAKRCSPGPLAGVRFLIDLLDAAPAVKLVVFQVVTIWMTRQQLRFKIGKNR